MAPMFEADKYLAFIVTALGEFNSCLQYIRHRALKVFMKLKIDIVSGFIQAVSFMIYFLSKT